MKPCNINHSKKQFLSKEYFDEIEEKKHFVEPHILEFADFSNCRGKKILEIGCGIGTAAINFIKNGAEYYGIELSNKSLEITKKRLEVYELSANLFLANAEENIDFLEENYFDIIYSFGVIHHSPNPDKIIKNIYKYLKPEGTLKLMLYAENSWKKILIDEYEQQYEAQNNCPLAYTYTNDNVFELLKDFKNININQTHIFPYKIEPYKNNIYVKEDWFECMPEKLFKILEKKLGWHLCIKCNK